MNKGRSKIMVVEDNDFVRLQICKFLQEDGFDTCEAEDGLNALQSINDSVNLILVDTIMSPMNGFDFIQTIRTKGMKTPVILMTGQEGDDALEVQQNLDICAILKKPVHKDGLIKTVSKNLLILS